MTERVNIRRLQGLESRDTAELPFDPRLEVTKQDWEETQRILNLRPSVRKDDLAELLASAKILDPHRTLDMPPRMPEEIADFVVGAVIVMLNDNDCVRALRHCFEITLISPEREHILSREVVGQLPKYLIDWSEDKKKWSLLVEAAAYLKVTNSPLIAPLLFSEGQIRDIENGLHNELISSRGPPEPNFYWWQTFSRLASSAKILFPEIKMGLTRGDWQSIKKEFHRRTNTGDRMREAARLAIIAADEVRVLPRGGLELVMQKKAIDTDERIPSQPHSLEL